MRQEKFTTTLNSTVDTGIKKALPKRMRSPGIKKAPKIQGVSGNIGTPPTTGPKPNQYRKQKSLQSIFG